MHYLEYSVNVRCALFRMFSEDMTALDVHYLECIIDVHYLECII